MSGRGYLRPATAMTHSTYSSTEYTRSLEMPGGWKDITCTGPMRIMWDKLLCADRMGDIKGL